MAIESLISDLTLIMIVAALVTLIFKKIKQPVVLGYIVAGFLISPNFNYLPTVVSSEDITVWADIGIIFLMFGLGLEFSFKKLATVGGSAFVSAITVIGSMILIGTGVGSALGWPKMDSIFLGCMLSMSSTMIILKAYEEMGIKQEKYAQVVLGTLVIEDIAGIFMMIILTAVSVGNNVSGFDLVKELGYMMILLAIWLLLGIFLIPSFLNKTTKLMSDEMLLIFSIGLCLGMVLIANLIGFSSALGAFMTGSILAGTIYGERIEHLIVPIKDMFGAIFFVSVGMLIEPELLIKYLGPILIITAVTILGQSLFATVGILLSGQSPYIAVKGGFSMVQIGEFSFILATLGQQLGVIDEFLYPVVVCVSVITAFTTAPMIKSADRAYEVLIKITPKKVRRFLVKMTSERQSTNDKETEWLDYIGRVLGRTTIFSAVMFLIYLGGTRYLRPFIEARGSSDMSGDIIAAIIMICAMIPCTILMHGSTKDVLFTKLWLKHRANRLPLLTLRAVRIFIAACFMALVVRSMFRIPFAILVIIALIPVWIIIRSDYLKGIAIDIELRFMSNFSQKTLAKEKKERGIRGTMRVITDSIHVTEYRVDNLKSSATLRDFPLFRRFHINVIKITREDGTFINLPLADTEIKNGDILHMIGTEEQIDVNALLMNYSATLNPTENNDNVLKDYIYAQTFHGIPADRQIYCLPIKVRNDMYFCRRTIKNSELRERYHCNVVAIERGNLPIISPDIETIILEGDMVWILGTKMTIDKLIKDSFLEPRKKEGKRRHY